MTTYIIPGAFYEGMEWEDFFSSDAPRVPSITISVEPARIPHGREFLFDPDGDGWGEAAVKRLDRETARTVLAAINGCRPEEIEIIEGRVAAAI